MKPNRYHLIALIIIVIWGTTFVSTKLLLFNGLLPKDIFFYRFLLAYVGIWFFGKTPLFSGSLKDELLLLLMGIFGGSLYFITENTALGITLTSNVALLVCTAPMFTAIFSRLFLKDEKQNRYLWQGLLLAFSGVAFVVFNGHFILQINPAGDLLSLSAALSWTFYIILLKRLGARYSTLFITRKVFFYGLLTMLPLLTVQPLNTEMSVLLRPVVWGNLLYLGIAASLLCFFFWNMVVKKLGAVRTTNLGYIVPLVALLSSAILLDEPVTWAALVGAALILSGVVLAER